METLKCLHVLPKTRMIVARFAGFFATIHSRWRHPSFFSHFQIYWSSSSRTEMNNKYFTLSMTFFVENVHEKSQKRNENFNYTFFLFQAIFSSFSGGGNGKSAVVFSGLPQIVVLSFATLWKFYFIYLIMRIIN